MKNKKNKLTIASLMLVVSLSATPAMAGTVEAGASLGTFSYGALENDGMLYQATLDYNFERQSVNKVAIQARIGSSSAADTTSQSALISVSSEAMVDSIYTLFLKSTREFSNGFALYGAVGMSSITVTTTSTVGASVATTSDSTLDYSYGAGLTKAFGEYKIGAEYVLYNDNIAAFSGVISKKF